MVLQQGIPVPVWGTAEPGLIATVQFAGQKKVAIADSQGRWEVRLDPMAANADPQELKIAGNPGSEISDHIFTNVLVGEVWVCSGQSNMEFPVIGSLHGGAEILAASFPDIRLFTVPNRPSGIPETSLGGATWCACSPETVATFSAVAYFFGRELHRRLKVPIGLINTSWGGTVAEAWTSWDGLSDDPATREIVETFERDMPLIAERRLTWQRVLKTLEEDERLRDSGNTKLCEGWADLAEPKGTWADMDLPGTWQSQGCNHSGIFWFRKTVEIPVSWAGQDLRLSIGATDKSDITYFNNEQVGSITMADRVDAWSLPRTYTVPGKWVKAGRNVLAVRVHSDKCAGGMTGPSELMNLSCPSCGEGAVISLAGIWRYAIEANYGLVDVPMEPPGHQNAPGALFNGMISPLLPYAIRGAIWYQGESNADRAQQYQALFPALIRDWRRAWGQGDFAFYFVQLANYMARWPRPSESKWAELREAQAMALALPNTGMAVAIDIGEADDIHPRNKHDVGMRLAFSALNQTYGCSEVIPCGPLFRSVKRDGSSLRILFDSAGSGLECRGETLQGFAVAGDGGRFVWASANIDNEEVVVSSPDVSRPTSVRYAWADNPAANLFNMTGLPASPFQAQVQ
ncbi:MAG: sialate O-acetylesterase [Terrimicrobiaceae bacterium]